MHAYTFLGKTDIKLYPSEATIRHSPGARRKQTLQPPAIRRSTTNRNELRKPHLMEQQSSMFHTRKAPPACSPPGHPARPVPKQDRGAQPRQGSDRGYTSQQPTSSYYLPHSPLRPTHNPVVWLSQRREAYCTSTGELLESAVLRIACPNTGRAPSTHKKPSLSLEKRSFSETPLHLGIHQNHRDFQTRSITVPSSTQEASPDPKRLAGSSPAMLPFFQGGSCHHAAPGSGIRLRFQRALLLHHPLL